MKIGILGGTFDPVHQGHLFIAHCARRVFALDRVLLMVARQPPHKSGRDLTPGRHRYAMVALACARETNLLAGDWELDQRGPSYTINTMRHFTGLDDGNGYCFVAGGDSLAEVHLWKDATRLLSQFCFIFVNRTSDPKGRKELPGIGSLREDLREVCDNERHAIGPGRTFLVSSDPPSYSSTAIRQAFREGRGPAPGALSPEVDLYIRKHRLYE